MAVHTYILVQTEVGQAEAVAEALGHIAGVDSAEHVTGPYDVIVRGTAADMDELGKELMKSVQSVQGITRTLTCPVVPL